MQLSFGLTALLLRVFFFFFLEKGKKLLTLLPLGIYVELLRKFSFSSRVSYFRRDLGRVEIDEIEYYVDLLFIGILRWFFRFIQMALPELFYMAFVGVFRSLDNIDQFAYSLFDGAYFPECNVVFGASCMNWASVFEWHKRFKEGRESGRDDKSCERSKEVNTPELIGQRVSSRVRVTMLRFLGSSGRDSFGRGQHSSNRVSSISSRTMH